MANNRVNVDISANVSGFVDGMNQASEAAQQYETETRKIQDSTINLNKELRAAKRQAQDLQAGYAALSKEAKNSAFGREMAKQLDAAKKKAAELIDLQGDLNTELKNLASDTATFDVLADGLSAVGSTMSAVTGTMGLFTDNTEMMTKAVTLFTTAESIASGAIKVKNLLQRQSSLMLGVAKVQQMALTAAENLSTAAKTKNTAATVAATTAQKAFNTVAKANPYVLLASAIIGVVSAFALFSDGADEATEAQNELTLAEENGKKVSETYSSTLANEYSKLMSGYSKLKAQWGALANNNQRKKFIEDHKNELKSLGLEINNIADAEAAFTGDTSKIVEAFEKRARAAAIAAKMTQLYSQEMEILERAREVQANGPKAGDVVYGVDKNVRKNLDSETKYSNYETYNGGKYYYDRVNGVYRYTQKGADEALNLSPEWNELSGAYNKNQESLKESEKLLNQLLKDSGMLGDSMSSNATESTKQITTYKEAVQEYDRLVNEQKQLQELMTSGRVGEEGIDALKKEMSGYETKIQDLADKWHIKPKIELEPPQDKDISKITEALSNALSPKTERSSKYEFNSLPKEFQKAADATISAIARIEHAREQLTSIMNSDKSSDAQISAAQDGLEELSSAYDKLIERANVFQNLNDETEKLNEHNKKLADTYSDIGEAVGSVGDMFSTLSKMADDDPALQVMGIVAQAVANMFAGYAKATAMAAEMGPWAWAAFATAGMAQTLALVAQLKDAAAFATGGIVGGSSYSGDNIYARLNSGEMVLNTRQQRNLFNLLDTDAMPQRGGTNVQVTGVVRGTDLLLVQKNTNKVRAKSGTQIYF